MVCVAVAWRRAGGRMPLWFGGCTLEGARRAGAPAVFAPCTARCTAHLDAHVPPPRTAGFCYINDIVLAILELLKVHQR